MRFGVEGIILFEQSAKNRTPRAWRDWSVANYILLALMVICDNDTRWNSTYLSMERALVLEAKIRVYSEDHKEELDADFMALADWDVIRELKTPRAILGTDDRSSKPGRR